MMRTNILTITLLIPVLIFFTRCNTSRLNETNDWEIITGANSSLVENSAADDIQEYLLKFYSAGTEKLVEDTDNDKNKIILGTVETNPIIKQKQSEGFITRPENPESFHVKSSGNRVFISGNDPVGVYYGIVFLKDFLQVKGIHQLNNLDTVRVPFFRHRGGGHLFEGGPQAIPVEYSMDEYGKWLVNHYINYNGLHKGNANLPDSIARKYGIYLYGGGSANFFTNFWADLGYPTGEWKKMHPGAITSSEPNYHSGKVLDIVCLHTPFGKEKHTEIVKDQLKTSSSVKTLVYTFGDWGAICGSSCPRCGEYPVWKRIIHWLTAIDVIVKEIDPSVKVIGRTWYSTAVDSLIQHTPAGIGIRTKEPCAEKRFMEGLEEDVYPDIMLWKKTLSPSYGPVFLNGARVRGDDFYASTGIGNTGESIDPVIGFQTPYIAAYKLKRLAENDIRNINVWWGGLDAWAYSSNHEVIKEMIWDPFQDPDKLVAYIAEKDFGIGLKDEVLALWQTIDTAMEVWEYVDWLQQFEEFVCRYDKLYLQPLVPDAIIKTEYYQYMWKNSAKLLPSQQEALPLLVKAEQLAKVIYEKAVETEVKERAKQQYGWLKMFNNIYVTQYNTLKIISMMHDYYNPEDSKTIPAFDDLKTEEAYMDIIKNEIGNCRNTIETIKFLDFPGFRFLNQKDKEGQEQAIRFLEDKIKVMAEIE